MMNFYKNFDTLFVAKSVFFENLELGSRWLDALEAAILLKRFKRKNSSLPSIAAIRNMVYRGQLHAHHFFGRVLFDRYEIENAIALSSLKKEQKYGN